MPHDDNQEKRVRKLVGSIERILNSSLEEIVSDLEAGEFKAREAAMQVNGLIDRMIEGGFEKEAGRLQAIFGRELREVTKLFSDFDGVTFSDVELSDLQVLVDASTSRIAQKIGSYGIDVQQELVRQAITGTAPDLSQLKETLQPKVFAQLETELGTEVIAFNRRATVAKAQSEGITYFRYQGPQDKVTRPFCNHLLGSPDGSFSGVPTRRSAVYTLTEIQDMQNKQGLNVFSYGGGWNCRHRWRPITEEKAKGYGYPN